PGVDPDTLALGDEVDVVQSGAQSYAVRRRVGPHVRHGRVARVEAVTPAGLLRGQVGPDTILLRPTPAMAAAMTPEREAGGGRRVSFDDQLGLALGVFGEAAGKDLALKELPTVTRDQVILPARTARLIERLIVLPASHPELARQHGVDIAR